MCDWLSREAFDTVCGTQTENLAKEAFARMNRQLDLTMQAEDIILSLSNHPDFSQLQERLRSVLLRSEFRKIWDELQQC